MFHIVIYWPDNLTQYRGSYDSQSEAASAAMEVCGISDGGRVTIVRF